MAKVRWAALSRPPGAPSACAAFLLLNPCLEPDEANQHSPIGARRYSPFMPDSSTNLYPDRIRPVPGQRGAIVAPSGVPS
jgi:hypothetical protein